jgi:hypothetical protein
MVHENSLALALRRAILKKAAFEFAEVGLKEYSEV